MVVNQPTMRLKSTSQGMITSIKRTDGDRCFYSPLNTDNDGAKAINTSRMAHEALPATSLVSWTPGRRSWTVKRPKV